MARPTISLIYPSNNQTAVPIGSDIEITFSNSVDLSTIKNNVVLYGADFDFASGAGTAVYLDKDGVNTSLLRSPGFKGIVECTKTLVYVDSNGDVVADYSPLTRDEEEGDAYTHKLILSPKTILSPELKYYVYLIGEDEEGTGRGVSAKTVYDVDYTSGSNSTGKIFTYGGYTGGDDVVTVKITETGGPGIAQYKWWYSDSETENDARTGKTTSTRFKKLEDGLRIRFERDSSWETDDVFTFEVKTKEMLEESYTFSFTTSTSQIVEVPDTASSSVLGDMNYVEPTYGYLEVLESTPSDGDVNMKFSDRTIVIEFNNDIDPDSIDLDKITVVSYPLEGYFDGGGSDQQLFKSYTVQGNKLIIEV